MDKIIPRLTQVMLILFCSTAFVTAEVCIYGSANFPGSFGCTTENCGTGCGPDYNWQSYWNCIQSDPSGTNCCICSWETFQCDCTFGTGYGAVSARITGSRWCPSYSPPGPQPSECVTDQ